MHRVDENTIVEESLMMEGWMDGWTGYSFVGGDRVRAKG